MVSEDSMVLHSMVNVQQPGDTWGWQTSKLVGQHRQKLTGSNSRVGKWSATPQNCLNIGRHNSRWLKIVGKKVNNCRQTLKRRRVPSEEANSQAESRRPTKDTKGKEFRPECFVMIKIFST